jgi:hypothetical protein
MDEAMGPMHRAVVAEAPVDSGNLAHGVIKEVKGEEKGRMKVEIKVKKAGPRTSGRSSSA